MRVTRYPQWSGHQIFQALIKNSINSSQASFSQLRYRTHILSCSVVEQSCVSSTIALQYFGTWFLMKLSHKLIISHCHPQGRVLSITGSMIQMVFEFWIIFGFSVNKEGEIPIFISFRGIPISSQWNAPLSQCSDYINNRQDAFHCAMLSVARLPVFVVLH